MPQSTITPQILALPEYSAESSYQIALTAAHTAADRKANDILLLAIGEVSALANYFVLTTGFSRAQIRAIATTITEQIAEQFERQPLHSSNNEDTGWILLDYGDVIVHIMMPQEREFYNLEAFWGHVTQLVLPRFERTT
ncbi:MAG: ribosome silencing factor [Pseudanabaenaceae cyanobacterium bins.68]|nr:ribosome silencing factor [Pseudanabaenaceae cyanobacterium bins.68]